MYTCTYTHKIMCIYIHIYIVLPPLFLGDGGFVQTHIIPAPGASGLRAAALAPLPSDPGGSGGIRGISGGGHFFCAGCRFESRLLELEVCLLSKTY